MPDDSVTPASDPCHVDIDANAPKSASSKIGVTFALTPRSTAQDAETVLAIHRLEGMSRTLTKMTSKSGSQGTVTTSGQTRVKRRRQVGLAVCVIVAVSFSAPFVHVGATPRRAAEADFDGDSKADITAFRPSTG